MVTYQDLFNNVNQKVSNNYSDYHSNQNQNDREYNQFVKDTQAKYYEDLKKNEEIKNKSIAENNQSFNSAQTQIDSTSIPQQIAMGGGYAASRYKHELSGQATTIKDSNVRAIEENYNNNKKDIDEYYPPLFTDAKKVYDENYNNNIKTHDENEKILNDTYAQIKDYKNQGYEIGGDSIDNAYFYKQPQQTQTQEAKPTTPQDINQKRLQHQLEQQTQAYTLEEKRIAQYDASMDYFNKQLTWANNQLQRATTQADKNKWVQYIKDTKNTMFKVTKYNTMGYWTLQNEKGEWQSVEPTETYEAFSKRSPGEKFVKIMGSTFRDPLEGITGVAKLAYGQVTGDREKAQREWYGKYYAPELERAGYAFQTPLGGAGYVLESPYTQAAIAFGTAGGLTLAGKAIPWVGRGLKLAYKPTIALYGMSEGSRVALATYQKGIKEGAKQGVYSALTFGVAYAGASYASGAKVQTHVRRYPTGEVTGQKYYEFFGRKVPVSRQHPATKAFQDYVNKISDVGLGKPQGTPYKPALPAYMETPKWAPEGSVGYKVYTKAPKPIVTAKGPEGIEFVKPSKPFQEITPSSGKYPGPSKIEFKNLVPKVGPGGIEMYVPKTPTKPITPSTGKYVGPAGIKFTNLQIAKGPAGEFFKPISPAKTITPISGKYQGPPKISFDNMIKVQGPGGIEIMKPKIPGKILTPSTGKYPGPPKIGTFKNLEFTKTDWGLEYFKPITPSKVLTPSTKPKAPEFPGMRKEIGPGGIEVLRPKVPGKILTPGHGFSVRKGFITPSTQAGEWMPNWQEAMIIRPPTSIVRWIAPGKLVVWEPILSFFEPLAGTTKPLVKITWKAKTYTFTDLVRKGVISQPTPSGGMVGGQGAQQYILQQEQIAKSTILQIEKALVKANQQAIRLKTKLNQLQRTKMDTQLKESAIRQIKLAQNQFDTYVQSLRASQQEWKQQLRQLSKQREIVTTKEEQIVIQPSLSALYQPSMLTSAQRSLQLQGQFQLQTPIQRQAQIQSQMQLQRQLTKQEQMYKFGFPSILTKKAKKQFTKEEDVGYYPEVRKDATKKNKARWVRVSKEPLPKAQALGIGGYVTDNTTSRRFRVIESKDKPKPNPAYVNLWSREQHKFRPLIRKGKKLTNPPYIEKTQYAIDTPGEFRGITVQGWKAIQRKKTYGTSNYKPIKWR